MLIHGSATEGVATGWHELIASDVAILYAALKARDPATAAAETIYEKRPSYGARIPIANKDKTTGSAREKQEIWENDVPQPGPMQ